MTVCDSVLQLFFWLDEIDEIGLNALVWDSKCVLTLWETSKTQKKKISHSLVQKQVDNGIINVLIIVESMVSVLDVNVGKTKRIYVWNTY
jgi:hypothetical protein